MNQTEFMRKRHSVKDGDIERVFTTVVMQGTDWRMAEYRGIKQLVLVKAYRIAVQEEYVWEGQSFRKRQHDFGFCTSRSGEVAHSFKIIQDCESLEDVILVIEDAMVDFRVALDKDAKKILRRLLGYDMKKVEPVVRTNRKHQPLKQIRLPWQSQ